jgi:hypothetical protein
MDKVRQFSTENAKTRKGSEMRRENAKGRKREIGTERGRGSAGRLPGDGFPSSFPFALSPFRVFAFCSPAAFAFSPFRVFTFSPPERGAESDDPMDI